MKILFYLFFVLIGTINFVYSQNNENSRTGKLILFIDSIKNNNGNIRIHLYNFERAKYFPKKTENCFKLKVGNIINGKCVVSFENLEYDTYCLSVHHDENANESMDLTFIGLPKEGWGISNNVKLWFRLPKFDECSFKIESENKIINVNMRY